MENTVQKENNTNQKFYCIPKKFFESSSYKKMSADSKLYYGILKDKLNLTDDFSKEEI